MEESVFINEIINHFSPGQVVRQMNFIYLLYWKNWFLQIFFLPGHVLSYVIFSISLFFILQNHLFIPKLFTCTTNKSLLCPHHKRHSSSIYCNSTSSGKSSHKMGLTMHGKVMLSGIKQQWNGLSGRTCHSNISVLSSLVKSLRQIGAVIRGSITRGFWYVF